MFNETWSNSTFPVWVIPPNPGRSLQADIVVCAVLTFLIASAFVALRFYTRGYVNRVLGASDWCILPALVGTFATVSFKGPARLTFPSALRGRCHSKFDRAYVLLASQTLPPN
jgi:hypothetical protein